MISVVIPTHDDEAVLGRTLGPLVAAAVAGLVREVILADGGSVDATLDIGEDAGHDAGWFKRLMKRKCEPVLVVRKMTGCAVLIARGE